MTTGVHGADLVDQIERRFDELLRERKADVVRHVEAFSDRFAALEAPRRGVMLPMRPRFLSAEQARHIEGAAATLIDALRRVPQEVFRGDVKAMAAFLRKPQLEELAIARFLDWSAPVALARPDGFFWRGQISFIEQNTSSSIGGYGVTDLIQEFFATHPIMQDLREHYVIDGLSPVTEMARFFRRRYPGQVVGFFDAFDARSKLPYDREGLYLVTKLQEQGIDMVYLEPGVAEVRDGSLWQRGTRIDVAFRNFCVEDLWDGSQDHARRLFEQIRPGAVELLSNPAEVIFENKLLLALISDPAHNHFLTSEERAKLDVVLPWTRLVVLGVTSYGGQEIQLTELLTSRQERFVLKKGTGWQALSVVMGGAVDSESWRSALSRALADGDWIVQERVEPESWLATALMDDGSFTTFPVFDVVAPFMIDGRFGGLYGRTSFPGGSALIGGESEAGDGLTTAFVVSSGDAAPKPSR